MTLAVAVLAREDFDGADRIDPHLGGFPQADAGAEATYRFRRRDTASFDITGYADAAQFAFRFGFRLAGREASIIDRFHRGVQRRVEVTDVVSHDNRRLMWKLGDEVLAAKLRRIDLQLPSRAATTCAKEVS